jgi:hypothetical protein
LFNAGSDLPPKQYIGGSPREIDKIIFKPTIVGSGPPKIVIYGR